MQTYIGTKIVAAEPEERNGVPGYKVIYADKYVSWSPKAVFEEAYRPISDGEAAMLSPTRTAPAGSFYDRLIAERGELQTRHQKLGEFIDSPAFRDLDEQQRELLIGQHEAMRVYSEILGERIRTIAPPESRSTARHSDKPDEIIGEGVRMIGGDQSEKPVPFEG